MAADADDYDGIGTNPANLSLPVPSGGTRRGQLAAPPVDLRTPGRIPLPTAFVAETGASTRSPSENLAEGLK